MRIEIITTQNEMLKETGFGSFQSCSRALASIVKMGHAARLGICRTLADLEQVVARSPDLVILAVKCVSVKDGEDIWLSEYFSEHEISYSGSIREVLKFDSDNVLAKSHLRKNGIRTANYFMAVPGQYKTDADLPVAYPLFLKPSDAANGNGAGDASLVSSFEEFETKVAASYVRFGVPVLAEEYLDGREFTVAVIRSKSGYLVVSPIEIVPRRFNNGSRIPGEFAKKEDSEELKKPELSELMNRVRRLAIDAFGALGVRDFGRIDIRTNKAGECFFMKANLVPEMTSGSSYFMPKT